MEFGSQLTPAVLKLLRAAQLDVDDFVRGYGFPADAIDRREVLMPLERWAAFSVEAMQELGDAALGMHIAVMAPRGSYGVLEFVARSAPTLGEAFELIGSERGSRAARGVGGAGEASGSSKPGSGPGAAHGG